MFLTSKFSCWRFCNPPRGTANRWELLLRNSEPPGAIIVTSQLKTGDSSHIIFITLFSNRCTALLRVLPASANLANMQETNPFTETNRHLCRVTYWASVGMLSRSSVEKSIWDYSLVLAPGLLDAVCRFANFLYCFILSLLPSNDFWLYPTHNALTATPSSVRNNLSVGLFHFVKWPCPGGASRREDSP
jgi:hypothetical protein